MDYSITFVGGYGPSSLAVEAEVASAALHRVMHPGGAVRVEFRADPSGTKAKPRFTLDSFQFGSLAEYHRLHAHRRPHVAAARFAVFVPFLAVARQRTSCARLSGTAR